VILNLYVTAQNALTKTKPTAKSLADYAMGQFKKIGLKSPRIAPQIGVIAQLR
jgi:hypothetical protein